MIHELLFAVYFIAIDLRWHETFTLFTPTIILHYSHHKYIFFSVDKMQIKLLQKIFHHKQVKHHQDQLQQKNLRKDFTLW